MAAVNRQLQAQLEEPVGARRDRRSSVGIGWIEQLATLGSSEASLVRAENGAIYVIEETRKRPVRSGLDRGSDRGSARHARDNQKELEGYAEGVPVELFESSKGAPFIVMGGMRHGPAAFPCPIRSTIATPLSSPKETR